MVVPVVDVRQVRMVVMEPRVPVDVRVRLVHRSFVTVRVMLVVQVPVLVLGRFVNVRVRVARSHDERCAERHQCSRDEMGRKWPLAEEGDGEDRPDERRGRKVGGLSGRSDGPYGEQKRTMLAPYPIDPVARAALMCTADGRRSPSARPRARLKMPAGSVLARATATGSRMERR